MKFPDQEGHEKCKEKECNPRDMEMSVSSEVSFDSMIQRSECTHERHWRWQHVFTEQRSPSELLPIAILSSGDFLVFFFH